MARLTALFFAGALWLAGAAPAVAQDITQSTVTIPANVQWVETNVQVRRGGRLEIGAPQQTWAAFAPTRSITAVQANPQTNAAGYPRTAGQIPGLLMPGANHGALIGRIGPNGAPFVVGLAYDNVANADGVLYLSMNDISGQFADNTGRLSARIAFTAPAPPASTGQQRTPSAQAPSIARAPSAAPVARSPAAPPPSDQRPPATQPAARPPTTPPADPRAPAPQRPEIAQEQPQTSQPPPTGQPPVPADPDAPPPPNAQGATPQPAPPTGAPTEDGAPPPPEAPAQSMTLTGPQLAWLGAAILFGLAVLGFLFRGRAPRADSRANAAAQVAARIKDDGLARQVMSIRVIGGRS